MGAVRTSPCSPPAVRGGVPTKSSGLTQSAGSLPQFTAVQALCPRGSLRASAVRDVSRDPREAESWQVRLHARTHARTRPRNGGAAVTVLCTQALAGTGVQVTWVNG